MSELLNKPFKPIKAPKRTPKPPPAASRMPPTEEETASARAVLRRALRAMRWDDQGGYSSRYGGRWRLVSSSIGQFSASELDALFKFAGIVADEIAIVGDCADCANSDNGYERGYAPPCISCLRPSHINNFVPRDSLLTKHAKLVAKRGGK